jgi:hypothetical protein
VWWIFKWYTYIFNAELRKIVCILFKIKTKRPEIHKKILKKELYKKSLLNSVLKIAKSVLKFVFINKNNIYVFSKLHTQIKR